MEPVFWVWLGMMVVFIVFELATVGLTTIWFAIGALVAFILNMLDTPLYVQIIAFIAVSVLMLVFTRPLVIKVFKVGREKTNIDSIVGMKVRVIVEVNNNQEMGYAVLNGQEWTARSEKDDVILPENSMAEVVEISGVKLILRPVKE